MQGSSTNAPVERWQLDIANSLGTAAAVATALFAMLFIAFPHLDVSFSAQFYTGGNNFAGKSLALVAWLRHGFIIAFFGVAGITIVGLIVTRLYTPEWLRLDFTKWLFLTICLVMGPGVVSNMALKDHWGRARPNQIVEFGGSKAFTAALSPSDQCNRNCSFVSGEVSSTFALFFAAAYLFRRRSAALVCAGIAAGAINGVIRMIVGAHFLSDIVFAGVFMAMTVALINFVFEAIAEASRNTERPPLASIAT